MKNLLFLLIALMLFSCQQRKKEIERLQAVQDSISMEAAAKDSALLEFLTGINEIQTNLDSIKELEGLINVEKTAGVELPKQKKQQILEDLNTLNDLLQKNKETIASLQKKLNNSWYQYGKLEKVVKELEVMVASLTQQVEAKDAEIVVLNNKVKNLELDISDLNRKMDAVVAESEQKSQVIDEQIQKLNTVYYAIGNVKELEAEGVIIREGGFLGIGKDIKIKEDFNKEYFTKSDLREFSSLPINVKKAVVLTVHPAGSYHITGEKTVDELIVDNPQEFWKASKYLLVVIQ